MRKAILISILCFWIGITSLQAAEARRIGQDYRSLAMGNTGIVTASTSSALHYNPAAMANVEDWWFNIPAAEFTFNGDGYAIFNNILQGVVPNPTTLVGQSPYIKVKLGTNFMMNISKKGTTFAANLEYENIIDFAVVDALNHTYYEHKDTITQAGFSYPFGLGQFVVGLGAKQVSRSMLEYAMVAGTYTGITPNPLTVGGAPSLGTHGITGQGISYDLGFIYRFASKSRWIIGGVYRGPLDFGVNLPSEPEEVAVGISTTRHFSGGFRFLAALDIRDLTQANPNLTTSSSRTHLGFELGYGKISQTQSIFTARAGLNQGYFTKGMEFALGQGMIFGYTEYAAEVGGATAAQSAKRMVGYFHMAF